MSKKTKPLLSPEYMKEFKCIGTECEDTCCAGFLVTIDKSTYKKYKNIRDKEFSKKIQENVIRNKENPTDNYYAQFVIGHNGCNLLTEEKLCGIHQKLGESYLTDTCAVYPRVTNLVDKSIEKSGALSCPEIARLVLLNKNGIDFEETEYDETERTLVKIFSTADSTKLSTYFWNLRLFTITLLQNRQYSISDRLILLGMVLNNIQNKVKESNSQEIPQTLLNFESIINNRELEKSLENIKKDNKIQIELCKTLIELRINENIKSKRYLECLSEMIDGLNYKDNLSLEENADNYNSLYELYYRPFMDEHDYIYENYLVNNVFTNLFPFETENIFEDYIKLVINFSLIKTHLIGMAGFHKGLSLDLVIKLIQSYSKNVEQHKAFVDRVLLMLNNNGFSSLAYMALLIKN